MSLAVGCVQPRWLALHTGLSRMQVHTGWAHFEEPGAHQPGRDTVSTCGGPLPSLLRSSMCAFILMIALSNASYLGYALPAAKLNTGGSHTRVQATRRVELLWSVILLLRPACLPSRRPQGNSLLLPCLDARAAHRFHGRTVGGQSGDWQNRQ